MHTMCQKFLLPSLPHDMRAETKTPHANEECAGGRTRAVDLLPREASPCAFQALFRSIFFMFCAFQHEQQKVRNAAVESGQLNDDMRMNATLSKTARAYAKTYKPGPPLVPNLIVERVLQYISKVII